MFIPLHPSHDPFSSFFLHSTLPSPAFQGQFVANFAHLHLLHNIHQEQPAPFTLPQAISTSLIATTLASICFAPFDLVNTRQQVDPLLSANTRYGYKSIYSAIPAIVKNESPFTFFRGLPFALTRNVLHTMALFTLYPYVTQQFHQQNRAIETFSYLSVAILSSLLLHPLDTLKTISQITPPSTLQSMAGSGGKVKFSALGAIGAHLKRNGVLSLYRGLLPSMAVTTGFPVFTYLTVDLLSKSNILK